MKTRNILAIGLVVLALISTIGITTAASENQTDNRTETTFESPAPSGTMIGPDNSLYGLKIAFENLDESFTANQSELLEKQINHADNRLTELRRELAGNKTDAADRALELYRQKINQTDTVIGQYDPSETGSQPGADRRGLEHAREMIAKHQSVLENLLNAHPDNPGLSRAYNNSLALEQKFENKLKQRGENRNGQVSGQNNTPWQTNPDLGQNRTIEQGGPRTGDDGRAGNLTWRNTGINQTVGTSKPGPDKTTQNGQGNSMRTIGSGNNTTVNPGNSQNGNANGNSGNINRGTSRTAAPTGGQGGNTDPKMKNR